MKALYDAGKVAVVQGLGYPNPDLSHFTSMAIWSGGRFGGGPATTGWLGRWLDGQPEATAEFAAAAIDTSVPLHLVGAARRGLAISPYGGMFGSDQSASSKRLYDQIRGFAAASGGRGPWHDAFATTMRRQLDVAADVTPVFAAKFPTGNLARKLTVAAAPAQREHRPARHRRRARRVRQPRERAGQALRSSCATSTPGCRRSTRRSHRSCRTG